MHWDKSFKSLGGTSAGVEVPHHQKRPPDLRNMNAQVTLYEDDPGPEDIQAPPAPLALTTPITLYEDDPGPEAIARAPLTQMTTIANIPLITNFEHDPGPDSPDDSLMRRTIIEHDPGPESLMHAHDTQSILFGHDPGPEGMIYAPFTQTTLLDHDPGPRGVMHAPVTRPVLYNYDPGPSKLSNILTIHGFDEITTNQHYRASGIKDSISDFIELHEASLAMPIEGIG
jgi:hypothetical protein